VRSVKIVVTGPFNAGKTTFIKTISEIAVVSTERKITERGSGLKAETTVAMDFGRITVDDDVALYLFGTPGQERFSFMWETLSQGMLGFVILIDSSTTESLEESRKILSFFNTLPRVPYVVAVNKINGDSPQALEKVRQNLDLHDNIPLFSCNALDKESVKKVLLGLLYKVLETVDKQEQTAAN
jgi:small GTP-binding protein